MNGGGSRTASPLEITRRATLKGAFGVGLVAAGAACSPDAGDAGRAASRGGDLRVAVPGGTTTSLSPLDAAHGAGPVALMQIYEPLVQVRDGTIENVLAESVRPNADATVWTIRLRRGLVFHDGRTVGAEDVAYSLQTQADPKRSPNYAQFYADMDRSKITVRDDRTVEVPLRRARGDFRDAVLSLRSLVFPARMTNWAKPNGTGPFGFRSTDSGGAVLARNEKYWGRAPYLDRVTISPISDPMARLNAVRSGQADYALDIPPVGARAASSDSRVRIRPGGVGNLVGRGFEMNVGLDPFTGAKVRTALKLVVDREQLVRQVLLGHGRVGNDLFGLGMPGYNGDLPQRTRDVDRARSLFAEAGIKKLTIRAADLVPGTVDSARLLAEQAREAGVRIDVQQAAADTYFADFSKMLSTPLQAFYFSNEPIVSQLGSYTGSRSAFNISGIKDDAYDERLTAAQATVDGTRRRQRFAELQRYLWDNGGDVVWGFAEQLDAIRPGVGGVSLCQSRPLLGTAYVPH